jgi:hypothetical protein
MSTRSMFFVALAAQIGIYLLQMWLRDEFPSHAFEVDVVAMCLVVLNTVAWVWYAKGKNVLTLLQVVLGSTFIWIFGLFVVPAIDIAMKSTGLVALPTMKYSVIKGLLIGVLFSLPIPMLLSLIPRRRKQQAKEMAR